MTADSLDEPSLTSPPRLKASKLSSARQGIEIAWQQGQHSFTLKSTDDRLRVCQFDCGGVSKTARESSSSFHPSFTGNLYLPSSLPWTRVPTKGYSGHGHGYINSRLKMICSPVPGTFPIHTASNDPPLLFSTMRLTIPLIVASTLLSQSQALAHSDGNTLKRRVDPAEVLIPELRSVNVSDKYTFTLSSNIIGLNTDIRSPFQTPACFCKSSLIVTFRIAHDVAGSGQRHQGSTNISQGCSSRASQGSSDTSSDSGDTSQRSSNTPTSISQGCSSYASQGSSDTS